MKNAKAIKKNLIRALAAVLLAATICATFASCAVGDKIKEAWGKIKEGATDIKNDITGATAAVDPLQFDFGSPENIVMTAVASGSIDATETEPAQVYKVIKATVSPDSATDKSTLWDVYWIDNQMGEDAVVTDYVTVMACIGGEPYTAQPGSNYCKVSCLQPFSGTVGVKVTTAVGGYTAECKVTYAGEPSYLGLHQVLEDGSYQHVTDTLTLSTGTTTQFKLALDNIFHNVGATYGQYEISACGALGKVMVKHGYWNGGRWGNGETEEEIDLSERMSYFANTVFSNDCLVISAEHIVAGYDYYDADNSYRELYISGAENVTFYVTVRDTISGVTNTLYFKLIDVDSVALSDSTLTF